MTDSEVTENSGENPAEIPAEIAPVGPPPDPPGWLTRLARRPKTLLAVLGLLLWLPGILSLPPLDRDESRFAQSSRQMVESGNWVDIRFGHVPRYKKPVGIYWLQTTANKLAGFGQDHKIWTYRLPSLLGAIAAAWATVWIAAAVTSAEGALLAGLLMLGSVLLTAEATIATTDAVLLACVLVVQGVLLRLYRAAREPDAPAVSNKMILWGWAAAAAGILVKFPVVPGVALVTIIALGGWDIWLRRKSREPGALRWLKDTRPLRGVILLLLLILPWLVAITIQSRGEFLEQSLGNDFATKLAGGQESHGMLPGYYLLLSAATFFPAILFVLPGLVQGIAHRHEAGIRFLLAWAGAWWLVVELVPTKLPHYVLSSYPALAILAAMFVLDGRTVKFLSAARWIAVAQYVIGAGLLTAALVMGPHYFAGPDFQIPHAWPLLAAAGVGACLALAVLVLALLRNSALAVMLSLPAMLVFVPALTAYAGPRLDQLWVTEKLKPLVERVSKPGDAPLVLAGYQEPSMLFAFGKDVVLRDGAGAVDANWPIGGLALVEDSERGAFLARLAEREADAEVVGEVSGFNYSRGRRVHILLYRLPGTRHLS
ncbi:MAG: glycosyltransferase family 39 protein [Alphaproteobacteria bacterium]